MQHNVIVQLKYRLPYSAPLKLIDNAILTAIKTFQMPLSFTEKENSEKLVQNDVKLK